MLELIKVANLSLRFLLELCALAALCYWGFKTGTGIVSKGALGIGTPLLAAFLWATVVAPGAPSDPCFGAVSRSTRDDSTYPIGLIS